MPGFPQSRLHLADGHLAEVEHAGGEHGIGAASDRWSEVLDRTRAAGVDQRNVHRRADGADQLEVEPGFGAIRVHRVEQNLSGPEVGAPLGPGYRIDAGTASS